MLNVERKLTDVRDPNIWTVYFNTLVVLFKEIEYNNYWAQRTKRSTTFELEKRNTLDTLDA